MLDNLHALNGAKGSATSYSSSSPAISSTSSFTAFASSTPSSAVARATGASSSRVALSDPFALLAASGSNSSSELESIELFLGNQLADANSSSSFSTSLNATNATSYAVSLFQGISDNSSLFAEDANFELTLDLYNNATSLNTSLPWWQNWDSIPYERSGYTQLGITLLGFFITVIMIMIVVGNLLVCIAISTEKSLKTVQNWFIASLAVSDLLLGLVIMPFSLAYELMGFWIFGDIWCEVHHALDVLLCTASINNLCLISLDRYWSVTQAVEYLKKRTPSRAMFMIAFVWIFSACVSLPPLVGWKGKEEAGQCSLSDDIGYVLYSAFGSFFIPAIVMVFVYARIFVAARSRARRHVKKKKLAAPSEVTNDPAKDKSTTTTNCTSLSNPSPPEAKIDDEEDESTSADRDSIPITPKTPPSPGASLSAHHATLAGHCPPRLTFRLPDAEDEPDPAPCSPSRTLSPGATCLGPPSIVVEPTATPHSSPTKTSDCRIRSEDKQVSFCTDATVCPRVKIPRLTFANNNTSNPDHTCVSMTRSSPILKLNGANNTPTNTSETRFVSADDDSDCVDSPITRTGQESKAFLTPNSGGGRLTRSPYGSSLSIADYDDSDICDDKDSDGNETKKSKKKKKGKVQYEVPVEVPVRRSATTEAERQKRKIAKARERRATIILGLIMGSFVSAWMPFFLMYLIQGICKEDCSISQGTFTVRSKSC